MTTTLPPGAALANDGPKPGEAAEAASRRPARGSAANGARRRERQARLDRTTDEIAAIRENLEGEPVRADPAGRLVSVHSLVSWVSLPRPVFATPQKDALRHLPRPQPSTTPTTVLDGTRTVRSLQTPDRSASMD